MRTLFVANISFGQDQLPVDGARVLGMDASSQILIVSGKKPGHGGEHILSKSLTMFGQFYSSFWSFFHFHSVHMITQQRSENRYVEFPFTKNGMLMMFDIRQTARCVESMEGLSRFPIHTICSLQPNHCSRKVLTASSAGPCLWDASGCGERDVLKTTDLRAWLQNSYKFGVGKHHLHQIYRRKPHLAQFTVVVDKELGLGRQERKEITRVVKLVILPASHKLLFSLSSRPLADYRADTRPNDDEGRSR
ncbi:hypothetical protein KSP40_PGU013164 [Platanthera guangdongensis]|uniref:Uncharacterized protein n=1 Tax=Platanthera guangdongensis TaxID=2320717 RepID=A0ABR2LSS5_9ASPA